MPSCAPASITDRFWPARITAPALRLPCSARASRRSRRAEISANSAPTKNAFAASSKTVSSTPKMSPPISDHPRSGIAAAAHLRQLEQIDAPAVHPDDRGLPPHRVVQRAVRIEPRELHRLSGLGDVAELLHHQAADGLVFALVPAESGVLGHLVDAQQPRHPPAVAAHPQHIGRHVVVLIADVADDLLDQVFHRHHARGSAVFVGHQHGLQPAGPDLGHHVVPVECRGHHRDRDGQAGQAGPRPLVRRHLEDLFDVHQPDRLVQVALDDREAGVAGLHRHHHQVGNVLVGLQRLDLGSRRHQLLGRSGPELQRAVHQSRRDRIEGAAARGVADQRAELLRRPGRSQLLGRLDAEPAQNPVGGAVRQLDHRGEKHREQHLRPGHQACGLQRLGHRKVLGNQLAEDHRHRRGDQQGQRQGQTIGDAAGQ